MFRIKHRFSTALLILITTFSVVAQTPQPKVASSAVATTAQVKQESVRQHMEALASDKMRGRGSATADELAAANYIASELKRFKIEPAGDKGGYIQRVALSDQSHGDRQTVQGAFTSNVVGILRGSDPLLSKEAVLLSAHLDHLGIGPAVGGDNIYNGADDDASGVTAVLELAQVLAAGPRPKRTVVFALFGSEETGGAGAKYFREHLPVPLNSLIANLEFEMIGRPDKMVAPHTLWLTGYERSNLGAELAAHGARLVADPHPEEHFFQRSDNYVLAKKGIIAHTVSSFGLHADYHQPSDDLAHIDFAHMTESIESMVQPVLWLVNSNFKPQWAKGGKP